MREGRWLISAPGEGRVELIGEGELLIRDPVAVWFDGEQGMVGAANQGVYQVPEGETVQETPDARLFAGETGLWLSATPDRVRASDGREWILSDVRALAVEGGRILAVACGGGCQAWELLDEPIALGTAGEGGRVGLWEGVAWWSDPETERPGGEGRIWSEAGEEIAGMEGDHLGRAFGGGYAVGALNPNVVPARARLLSLTGGGTLAVDRAVETHPLALAGDAGELLVGIPYWPDERGVAGAVHAALRADLP